MHYTDKFFIGSQLVAISLSVWLLYEQFQFSLLIAFVIGIPVGAVLGVLMMVAFHFVSEYLDRYNH